MGNELASPSTWDWLLQPAPSKLVVPIPGLTPACFFLGAFSYGMGFLIHSSRASARWRSGRLAVLGLTLLFLGLSQGSPKIFPLLLLEACLFLRFDRAFWLMPVGEAAGTIYAYHAPFILQPLVILTTCLSFPFGGFCAVAGAIMVILRCTAFYYGLRSTPFRQVLL